MKSESRESYPVHAECSRRVVIATNVGKEMNSSFKYYKLLDAGLWGWMYIWGARDLDGYGARLLPLSEWQFS